MKRKYIPWFVVILVLLLDQASKIYIKLTFYENQVEPVFGNWFRLYFVENEGMAFGWTFSWLPEGYDKLFLTVFRIVAVFGIGYYLSTLVKSKAPKGLIVSIALILSGAAGNILDSIFYGLIFTDSYGRIADIFPAEGGYGSIFHGKVVDMISIHLFRVDHVPDWVPGLGGKPFIFFGPIFNIADVAITAGVLMIILFQKRYFEEDEAEEVLDGNPENSTITDSEGGTQTDETNSTDSASAEVKPVS